MKDRPEITTTDSAGGRRYHRTKSAANYIGLSSRTLEQYRVKGGGPRFIKYGGPAQGLVLYEERDLDEWMEARRRSSTSDPDPVQ